MSKTDEILPLFPQHIRSMLCAENICMENLQEIRLRVNQPLTIKTACAERFLPYRVAQADIRDTVEIVSGHSLYAFEEEIKRGFLTVPGGHRVGIGGRVVMEEGRTVAVAAIRNISFINLRVSHEVIGCALPYYPYLLCGGMPAHGEGADRTAAIGQTLILAGPGGGKTTMLRDLTRLVSRAGNNVSVIDERSEIAGCYQGVPANDLGPRTDVLDACPKAVGMEMAIRSLAPDVLSVDEIGGRQDLGALADVMNCGCRVLATMHAGGLEDLKRKPYFAGAWESGMFERYLIRSPQVPAGRPGAWRVADGRGDWIL